MPLQRVPKIEIRADGEVWVCIGHHSINESLGVIRAGELAARDAHIAANERKRMAYVLDNLESFADFIQWRGKQPNPPDVAQFLDAPYPWSHEAKSNAQPS